MLPLFIFSKVWILFLLAFMFLKFAGMGRHHKCGHARSCNRYKTNRTDHQQDDQQKPPFEEKDIVPDGQSGF